MGINVRYLFLLTSARLQRRRRCRRSYCLYIVREDHFLLIEKISSDAGNLEIPLIASCKRVVYYPPSRILSITATGRNVIISVRKSQQQQLGAPENNRVKSTYNIYIYIYPLSLYIYIATGSIDGIIKVLVVGVGKETTTTTTSK